MLLVTNHFFLLGEFGMRQKIYRYRFQPSIDMEEIETSLALALIALENLHGESKVRLEASHALDAERRSCVIDASSRIGQDFNRLFVGFVRREFGEDSFQVQRVKDNPACNVSP